MISGRQPNGGGSKFCGVGDFLASRPLDCAVSCDIGGGGGGALEEELDFAGAGGGGGGPVGNTCTGTPIAEAGGGAPTPILFC